MAADDYVAMRFRRIAEWTAARPQYSCGWPNFERADYHDGRGLVYGHYLLSDAVADWRDVPAQDLGNPQTLRERFARTNSYAVQQGYQHGFPNFEQANYGAGLVYGTHLIAPGLCEFRDVLAIELGLLPNPADSSMDLWFFEASRYANLKGYPAAMPTGHAANYGQGYVCGILLFPPGSVQWMDIPGTELGIESGLPPARPPQHRPPVGPPDERPIPGDPHGDHGGGL